MIDVVVVRISDDGNKKEAAIDAIEKKRRRARQCRSLRIGSTSINTITTPIYTVHLHLIEKDIGQRHKEY